MITNYFKNLVMDNLFHTPASAAFPEKYYLAWSTTVPTEDGTGFTEPAASTGYARIELSGLNAANNGTVDNATKLAFAESLSHQGVAAVYGIFDSDSIADGKLLIYNEFDADDKKTVEKGTVLFVKPNQVQFTLKGL